MNLTGRRLKKYELRKRVGQGGMAAVYQAHQPTIDRFVAVKVLHSHLAENAEFVARFKREAKGLGQLRHPHIVNVIDFDEEDGWYFMVMDFVEGETLEAVLARRRVLPLDEALRLTAQLADALDYAHRNGRIHRDIKPGNVMFADATQQHAVLTDFGLTRLLDNVTLTSTGTIAGTPAYMSPEAAQGKQVDARSDIFSLGVVLYELVTGQRPYQGETSLSVIMKLVTEEPPPALSINPDLPPTVDAVLRKAMAKQPEDRYQTAAEMRQAIVDCGLRNGVLATTVMAADAMADVPELDPMQQHEVEETPAPRPSLPTLVEPVSPPAPPQITAVPSRQARSNRRLLPLLIALGLLIIIVAAGMIFRNRGEENAVAPPVTPTAASVVDATATPAAPETAVSAGILRFAEPDRNNLRQYTLSLDEVPPPPAGFHYELWFDFAGQSAPENVARVEAENGRIVYTDVLVDNLSAALTGVRISLEPEFDDDPSISASILFTGTVADQGVAEIEMFTVAE